MRITTFIAKYLRKQYWIYYVTMMHSPFSNSVIRYFKDMDVNEIKQNTTLLKQFSLISKRKIVEWGKFDTFNSKTQIHDYAHFLNWFVHFNKKWRVKLEMPFSGLVSHSFWYFNSIFWNLTFIDLFKWLVIFFIFPLTKSQRHICFQSVT